MTPNDQLQHFASQFCKIFFKSGHPGFLYRWFSVFSNKHYNFYNIRCRDSNPRSLERESPPITTRPVLQNLPPHLLLLPRSFGFFQNLNSKLLRISQSWLIKFESDRLLLLYVVLFNWSYVASDVMFINRADQPAVLGMSLLPPPSFDQIGLFFKSLGNTFSCKSSLTIQWPFWIVLMLKLLWLLFG